MEKRKNKKLHLTDIFSIEELQRLQDTFFAQLGISSGISDADGIPVTHHVSRTDFCEFCIKRSAEGQKRCEACDKEGMERAVKKGEIGVYRCHAGLMDFAVPIVVHGELLGAFLGGQVAPKPLSETDVLHLAWELGEDAQKFWHMAQRIPIMSESKLRQSAEWIYNITDLLAQSAYHRYEILQSSEEIEKAANMKSDFLANMSHEIRTPMNAVIGMAQMALREDLSPTARDYVNQIITSGQSLLAIINDILDFSKIESGKMELSPIDYEPMSIINDVTSIIMTRIGSKEVELILDITPDLPNMLYGDNIRIKQIIVNLSNNAVKFTESGQVVLKVATRPLESDYVEVQISVQDTGIGIKRTQLSKLFQSFYQVDSKRNRNIEGTGLGLAISQQLVQQMGGNIGVESEYGMGSLFYFSFPQKIIDERPSVHIENKDNIFAVSLLNNEYVAAQLERDMDTFEIEYRELTDSSELSILEEKEEAFFFVEQLCFDDEVEEFVKSHPGVTAVLLVDFNAIVELSIPNLIVIKKPLYSLNLAMLLNREDLHSLYANHEAEDFDFIAPEAKILIVDDNAINLTVAEGLLRPIEMQIDTAISGKEAIEMITMNKYDLIFMDHMMPELDGVETTHIIRRFHRDYKDVPIIALTANAVEGVQEMFVEEGMNDFVAKPIELKFIASKLKQWLPADKIQRSSMIQKEENMTEEPELQIEGLDVEYSLGLLGTKELYMAVLKDYYQAIDKKVEMILKYQSAEDWQGYTVEVHALKSASRQIGALELSDLAESLEAAGNKKNVALIQEKTEDMLKWYASYKDILAKYFQEDQVEEEEKAEIYSDLLSDCFGVMRNALENLDMDQMDDVLAEMLKYRYEGEFARCFDEFKTAVESLDVDSCERVMSEWEAMF